MGSPKLGFIFFLLLLFQFHLLPAFPISLKSILLTDFDQQQIQRNKLEMQERLLTEVGAKHAVSVNRRGGGGGGGHGGGGGGHAGGGGSGGGEGAHGNNGGKTPFMGGAVIPLYAAGAGGTAANHRNDHQHHGANGATPLCSGLINYLVLVVLSSLVICV